MVTFKGNGAVLTTIDTSIFTASKPTVFLSIIVVNIHASDNCNIFLKIVKDGGPTVFLSNEVNVDCKTIYNPTSGKIILEAGDQLYAKSSSNDSLHIYFSYSEM